jgi:ferredoxin
MINVMVMVMVMVGKCAASCPNAALSISFSP